MAENHQSEPKTGYERPPNSPTSGYAQTKQLNIGVSRSIPADRSRPTSSGADSPRRQTTVVVDEQQLGGEAAMLDSAQSTETSNHPRGSCLDDTLTSNVSHKRQISANSTSISTSPSSDGIGSVTTAASDLTDPAAGVFSDRGANDVPASQRLEPATEEDIKRWYSK